MTAPDAAERARALDINGSFLVQAPAGSGKTELLTQRFLALLGQVERPESIVAITFTNKAAGEMRDRISGALRLAAGPPPDSPHKRATWNLAAAVLRRNRELGWDLERNSTRLRVMTLDALCAWIAGQMPWMSRLGGPPAMAARPVELHQQAALRTLALLETSFGGPVRRLLLHMDNNHPRARDLIAALLARRDQWLVRLGSIDREKMEAVLDSIVRQATAGLWEQLPPGVVSLYHSAWAVSDPTLEDLAGFLLTNEGAPRKIVDKRQGFPPGHPRKQEMLALVGSLDPAVAARLHNVRLLPDRNYTGAQWELIESLFELMKLATAQLRLVFQERREVDFVEVQLRALEALGGEDEPAPLAYALDHRIEHLLLDEFQDTSVTKLRLLERLTAEWTPGDGRTLFAVGDPMQSIYSFQEAEVSLFERCRLQGLGRLPLTSLVLTANFRSSSTLVDWFNHHIPGVMGAAGDAVSGAVAYAPSVATQPEGGSCAAHSIAQDNADAEADLVAGLVEAAPDTEIAILVRRRADAREITRELRARGIRYQAVELERLVERPAVGDLHALTRALLQPDDRVAYLSVLRAPWSGRTLEQLLDPAPLNALENARAARGRSPLRQWVEQTWRELGGPACLRDEAGREDAEAYFQFLEQAPEDLERFEQALAEAWAPPDPKATSRLRIMTMHKAKGLEFDTVILPGLGRAPRPPGPALLRWRELEGGLVIGSMREFGGEVDRVYSYLGRLESLRQDHEANRLFYVAATRARRQLHLVGWPGAAGSFTAKLGGLFVAAGSASQPVSQPVSQSATPVLLRRLVPGWQAPPPPPALEWSVAGQRVEEEEISYDWSGETLRLVGTAVHAVLQRIGKEGLEVWTPDHLQRQAPALTASLATLGVPKPELPAAVERARRAIEETIRSERGRWLLANHAEARCEWELSAVFGGEVRRVQLDRTFIAGDGVRWIIDYKTSSHEGGNLEGFLASERERYNPQLERYAEIVSRLDPRPIRLGLYFPLLGAWSEWPYTRPAGAGRAG